MSHTKKAIFCIIVLSQLMNFLCQNSEPIQTMSINLDKLDSKIYHFDIKQDDINTKKILLVKSTPVEFSKPGFMYASYDENISLDNRIFSSQVIGTNSLYISLSKRPEKTRIYILLYNPRKDKNTQINLSAELISRVELNDQNRKIKIKLSEISQIFIKSQRITHNGNIMIFGLDGDWDCFDIKGEYKTKNNNIAKLKFKQRVETGHGALVDLNKVDDEINITIINGIEYDRTIEVGFEVVDGDIDYQRSVNILEQVYGFTDSLKNCYKVVKKVDKEKNPVMFINALIQAVNVMIYSKDNNTKFSQDVFDNSYIRFNTSIEIDDYFCIKKFTPKGKQEELDETSYNFQIYYEDCLDKDQMFIMPLANGRFFTHTLKEDKLMVYRHINYGNYEFNEKTTIFIYSAYLLKIKGNPKLYGYTCNTFPNCDVDKNTPGLEEIEQINQYYINKKENAIGNIEVDPNGESVEGLREQYLSVVICESGQGDCEYTIEITNQNEDNELAPGKVFATSIIPDNDNYFSVKIINYQDIKKVNISLTVLTGNAHIYIYSDFDLLHSITESKYHNVFRREVYELTDVKIIDRYWGMITCTEPSFIELKFETDFSSNGYMIINSGEVNIEYIDKEYIHTYSLNNPFYNNKKDFYYKIKTKECSMNYNDSDSNISNNSLILKHFKQNDGKNYLQNYIFSSIVYNYNTNPNDDSTDCDMIIYSGEPNSLDNPLLIVADYPLLSDFDNNHYIYPFFKYKYFKGIMIDIKFIDINNGKPSYNVSLKVKGNIVEEKTLTKDERIFIEQDNNRTNCGQMQCLLHIEIKKNSESDKAYNFTVNVFSSESSYPQVIEEKIEKILIPKNGSKTIQIAIEKDEEIEIKLDYSSGQGKVKAKLIPKSQINEDSYIFEADANNLLDYEPNNRIIRITKAQSDICYDGCELVMLIEVENNVGDYSEVSISKNPIQKSESKKKDHKIEGWLAAVLVIVCAIIVAGALVLVYFLVLRKKNNNMATRPSIVNRSPNNYYPSGKVNPNQPIINRNANSYKPNPNINQNQPNPNRTPNNYNSNRQINPNQPLINSNMNSKGQLNNQ